MNNRKGVLKVIGVLLMIFLGIITFGPGIWASSREKWMPPNQDELSRWELDGWRPDPPAPPGVHSWMSPEEWKQWSCVSMFIDASNPNLPQKQRHDMADAIVEWSKRRSLPLALVVAVCHVESNFRAEARGPKTKYGQARGAMQVMWPLHKDFAATCGVNEADMTTADGGVKVGTLLLETYIKAAGSIAGGLSKYYSKPSAGYIVEKVMASYWTFEQLYHGLIYSPKIAETHQKETKALRKIMRGH